MITVRYKFLEKWHFRSPSLRTTFRGDGKYRSSTLHRQPMTERNLNRFFPHASLAADRTRESEGLESVTFGAAA